jgi:hypothetical protein
MCAGVDLIHGSAVRNSPLATSPFWQAERRQFPACPEDMRSFAATARSRSTAMFMIVPSTAGPARQTRVTSLT